MHVNYNIENNITVCEVSSDIWLNGVSNFEYSLFLRPEWICSVENENSKPIFLNFECNNIVVAKLSGLVCNEGKFKGNQLFCYASPALKVTNQKLFDDCHSSLIKFAKTQRISRVIICSYDQQHSLQCKATGFYSTTRFEYIVDFQKVEQEVHFSKGFRKNMKKTEKVGASLKSTTSENILSSLFELLNTTRKHRVEKYGSSYDPFYLRNMNHDSVSRFLSSGLAQLYYVSHNGESPHCVQLNIESDGKVYGLLMGSDGYAYDMGMPSYVDYNLITSFNQKGFKYYNPGGGGEDAGSDGIVKYKKSMGGEPRQVFGCTTNFLIFPYVLLNPLMIFGRLLPTNNLLVSYLKKRFG
jgi:hypothetical protein